MNAAEPSKRPLYVKVHAELVERIRSGHWKAGQAIPNEFEIAAEFKVSQGTARKAVAALAGDHLVVRRQGSGTFVYEHTPDDITFRFINLFEDGGKRIVPASRSSKLALGKARPSERKALQLAPGARVFRIDRMRTRDRKPFITESIALPEAAFPRLNERTETLDTLYDVFQKFYGIHVTRTEERLTPATADVKAAGDLRVPVGAPLLRIERTAFAIDDRPVEWRVSLCHLKGAHYLARTR